MKKLLLIVALFLNLTAFAQELDTVITKNNYIYRFEKTGSIGGLVLKNETTYREFLKPPTPVSEDEARAEFERVVKQMKGEGGLPISNCFLNIFKETFKNCGLENFNHTRALTFFISINSKGEIADLCILLNKDFINFVGYDKAIELETNIKKKYKFKPFINQKVEKLTFITVTLKRDQLNSVFK